MEIPKSLIPEQCVCVCPPQFPYLPIYYTCTRTHWIAIPAQGVGDKTRQDETRRGEAIRYDIVIRYDSWIRYDTVRYDIIRYDTIWYDTIRYDPYVYKHLRVSIKVRTWNRILKVCSQLPYDSFPISWNIFQTNDPTMLPEHTQNTSG